MPAQLGNFPKGLLSLLGLQNFGESPRLLSDTVSPVVDQGEQLLLNFQESLFGANAAAANGFNAFAASDLVVPPGDVWRLIAFSVTVVAGVGCTGRMGCSVRTNGPGAGPRFPISNPVDWVASTTNWVCMTTPPFWLLPGYQLGVEVAQLVGGPPVLAGQIIFDRLRA